MEVKVTAKYLKHTPDKIRPIISLYVGKSLKISLKQIKFINKAAAEDIYKLMKSAEAAGREKEMNLDIAIIKQFYCNEGPKLKRRIPRSRGRISPFSKRLSHLTLCIEEKEPEKKLTEEKEANGTKS